MEHTKNKYKFKDGEEVTHIDFPTQKMNIERLVKSQRTIKVDNVDTTISYIEGIRCHWWAKGGDFKTGVFHTNELIPWDIAVDGFISIQKWLAEYR